MMIEKIGAKNLKSSCRMMIEKVMIQLGVHFNRKGGGGGPRGTCDADDAGSQGQKPTGKASGCEKPKQESRQKPKSQKAKKPPAAAELAMQRMRKERNCECR